MLAVVAVGLQLLELAILHAAVVHLVVQLWYCTDF